MKLHVFVDPSFKSNIWCRQYLKAISDEAALKRYTVNIIDSEHLDKIDCNTLYDSDVSKRLLIYIGATVNAADSLSCFFEENNIHAIFINYHASDTSPELYEHYSNIIPDYSNSMKEIVRYLIAAGKDRIALYGINKKSVTDMKKVVEFESSLKAIGAAFSNEHIYYNKASLDNCYAKFSLEANKYNAVICANDIVALSLQSKLKLDGIVVPNDMYIVSFGNTMLAKLAFPSITTSSFNLSDLGKQAVYLYSYLSRRESNISVTVKVSSDLCIRGSTNHYKPSVEPMVSIKPTNDKTALLPLPASYSDAISLPYYSSVGFFDDPQVIKLLRVENLLCRLYDIDMQIIMGLINSDPIAKIAERLYTSQQSISYRIKRMCRIAEVKDTGELLEFIRPYLNYSQNKIEDLFQALLMTKDLE